MNGESNIMVKPVESHVPPMMTVKRLDEHDEYTMRLNNARRRRMQLKEEIHKQSEHLMEQNQQKYFEEEVQANISEDVLNTKQDTENAFEKTLTKSSVANLDDVQMIGVEQIL